MGNEKLPPGWVEAKDPGSGAFYYYDESTRKSQWEKPCEASLTEQSTPCLGLPKSWVEALDETTVVSSQAFLQLPLQILH